MATQRVKSIEMGLPCHAGDIKENEGGLQDVVVVGAGISGLVTAQAFVAEHADTIKK